MMRFIYILLFAMLWLNAWGQSKNVLLTEADYYFTQEDYYAAVHFYEQSLEKYEGDMATWYAVAEAYRFTYQYALARDYYAKVYQLDQGLNYPNARLWEGVMLKYLGDYELASIILRSYLEIQEDPSDFWYRKALMELKGSELAKELQPNKSKLRQLGEDINSKVSDFAPFALGDSLLYFTSLHKSDGTESEVWLGHHAALFLSENEGLARPLRMFNSPHYHVGNASFNPTGDQVFFTYCAKKKNGMHCEVYTSRLMEGLWSAAEKMPQTINKEGSNNTHPQWAFWQKQEGLFIASNRAGGLGGMDIWFVPLEGSAINLGNSINTAGDELTPFFHSIEQKLYFSSDFHPGIGGFDIFETAWQKTAGWGLVKNIGAPLNSSHNDLYYMARLDSVNKGYLSSNRVGSFFVDKESCCSDIYAFERSSNCICEQQDSLLREIQLNLPITLYFHNDEPNPNSRDTFSSVSYATAFHSFYQRKGTYKKRFSSVLTGPLKDAAEKKVATFFEESVKGGFNQLEIFAQQLVVAMALQARVEIRIKGFTSPLNDTDYNECLAKRRIASVMNYLREYKKGVLKPFIDREQFKIIELPLGEQQVRQGVSDNPNDRRQSVYSVAASRERRIEIQSVSVEF